MTKPEVRVPRPFPLALLCLVFLLACAGDPEQDATSGAAETPATGAPSTEAPAPPGADASTVTPGDTATDSGPMIHPRRDPSAPGPDTTGRAAVDDTATDPGPMIHPRRDPSAPGPDTTERAAVDETASSPADTAGWSVQSTAAPARLDAPPMPVLADLRTGTHPDYARMTVEIGEGAPGPPGYRAEYVDRPLIECGSGRQIFPVGDAWLEIRFEPAAAHTEAGQPTLGDREITVDGPLLLRVYRTCDFEGIVTLVMALASPNPYRVLTLTDPWRIVVDVQR